MTRARERRTLAVVVLATALIVIDTTIIGVALPDLRGDLGGDLAAAHWVVVGYAVTFGASILPTATLSDRLGTRRLFGAGVTTFVLASAGCALAWSVPALGMLRTVQGLGAGMIFATAVPLVARAHSEQRRAWALAIWAAAAGSCSAAGPLLGGVLVELAGWRAIFVVNLPLGGLALGLAARWLAADRPGTAEQRALRQGERVTAAGLTLGLLLVFYVLNSAPRQGWTAATSIAAVGGGLLLTLIVGWQLRTAEPLVDLRLFRRLRFTGAATLSFTTRFTTMAAPIFLVVYFQQALGSSAFGAGVTLVPMFTAAFCGGLLAGRAQSRFPVTSIVMAGFGCAAVGAFGTALMITPDGASWQVALPLVGFGFGFGLSSTPLIAVAVASAPPERAGMASGLANCLIPMGTAAGTAILGIAFGTATRVTPESVSLGASRVMYVAAAISVLAVVLAGWSLRSGASAPVAAGPAREEPDE